MREHCVRKVTGIFVIIIVSSVRRDQVRLLGYGLDRAYFKQKQEIILQNFWRTEVKISSAQTEIKIPCQPYTFLTWSITIQVAGYHIYPSCSFVSCWRF